MLVKSVENGDIRFKTTVFFSFEKLLLSSMDWYDWIFLELIGAIEYNGESSEQQGRKDFFLHISNARNTVIWELI